MDLIAEALIDCGIEASGVRTRSRLTLWLTAAMMVIHLKAQYKYAYLKID